MSKPTYVALVNRKGGVGKTTLTVSLAAAIARDNKVLVIDADPQASLSQWSDQSGGLPFDVVAQTLHDADLAEVNVEGYSHVLIDYPPGFDDAYLLGTLPLLDHILVPVNPSPVDLWATVTFSSMLDEAFKARDLSTRTLLVFNQVERDNRFAMSAVGAARGLGLKVAKTILRKRAIYRTAALEGSSIYDLGARGKQAVEEMNELMCEVFGQ